MKKIIKNTWLLICAGVVVVSIPLLLANDKPIEINLPLLTQQDLAEKKQAADQAAKATQRKQKEIRVSACQTDEDCIIVDKDPCGCYIGPKGVTAINMNYVTDFNSLNATPYGMRACPVEISVEKECSPTARPVCKARRCKIVY